MMIEFLGLVRRATQIRIGGSDRIQESLKSTSQAHHSKQNDRVTARLTSQIPLGRSGHLPGYAMASCLCPSHRPAVALQAAPVVQVSLSPPARVAVAAPAAAPVLAAAPVGAEAPVALVASPAAAPVLVAAVPVGAEAPAALVASSAAALVLVAVPVGAEAPAALVASSAAALVLVAVPVGAEAPAALVASPAAAPVAASVQSAAVHVAVPAAEHLAAPAVERAFLLAHPVLVVSVAPFAFVVARALPAALRVAVFFAPARAVASAGEHPCFPGPPWPQGPPSVVCGLPPVDCELPRLGLFARRGFRPELHFPAARL